MPLIPKSNKIVKMAKTILFGVSDYTPSSLKIINMFKDEPIISLKVIRKELSSGLTIALEAVNFGQFKSRAKELGYDKLYHLSMIIDTDKGRFLIEKNEVITCKLRPTVSGETLDINVNKKINVETLLNRTKQYMGNRYFTYDAQTNNCANFILSILKANHLSNAEIDKFIREDLEGLFKKKPASVINTAIETGSRLHQAVEDELN